MRPDPPLIPARDQSDLISQASAIADSRSRELRRLCDCIARQIGANERVYGFNSEEASLTRSYLFFTETERRASEIEAATLRAIVPQRSALELTVALHDTIREHTPIISAVRPLLEVTAEIIQRWDSQHAQDPPVVSPAHGGADLDLDSASERSRSGSRPVERVTRERSRSRDSDLGRRPTLSDLE